MYNLNPKNKNECHSVNVKVVNLNVIDQDNNVGQGHKAEDEVKNVDMKVHSTSRFLLKKNIAVTLISKIHAVPVRLQEKLKPQIRQLRRPIQIVKLSA